MIKTLKDCDHHPLACLTSVHGPSHHGDPNHSPLDLGTYSLTYIPSHHVENTTLKLI
ncbi:hypothetical protein SLEP1_g46889 [Rubroshorea leprosula]|uniref:Uncharacterized protein n=1 Tax=Rubroshorea leprosula TaxID=152421 RepID=A0AAV5LNP8_9ROSI|nr:hypothetical protein SLEP1_g46889 [Rubroshorea leprosula]